MWSWEDSSTQQYCSRQRDCWEEGSIDLGGGELGEGWPTIPPDACLDTPPHLEEFDRGYIRDYPEEVIMRRPADTRAHPVINYVEKHKLVEEACDNNP